MKAINPIGAGIADELAIMRQERDRARATAARLEADSASLVEQLLALHAPWGVYDECDCPEAEREEPGHLLDFGIMACRKSLEYWTCLACCSCNGEQTECCVDHHKHTTNVEHRCPTVRAIVEWSQP